jgi:hypothetical protein
MEQQVVNTSRRGVPVLGRAALHCNNQGGVGPLRILDINHETWTIIAVRVDCNDDAVQLVALQSWSGNFLSAMGDGVFSCTAGAVGHAETWELHVHAGDGKSSASDRTCMVNF